jgi:hypothetical protein
MILKEHCNREATREKARMKAEGGNDERAELIVRLFLHPRFIESVTEIYSRKEIVRETHENRHFQSVV